ncbi:60S ribosomal protein L13 [Mitosporidium daphniae]|uniref:60S ribosomal protein L13 n=1 Tax=Mitosporidium daphniae TaxID=1485682 RepID=A0A098VVQ3_9MICR|nr:60S ribosomal protein L13 [Mitosporidium daphniae]KGG53000.1 60S ribosomal protein L13 [Mitosporidium daphniae]|eukprot:XP_013239436.1 60S ribosomal protein L13 [Mitosporidium daphniae]
MKHNNQLPNVHLRKHWQVRVKTWFDQAGRKHRRRLNRQKKAALVAPHPLDSLRPAVRCPTIRYNTKLREGRGFTFEEIKAAGLDKHHARRIGISVDHRRRNRSAESLEMNVQRLKAYLSKVVILDAKKKEQPMGDSTKSICAVLPVPKNTFQPESSRQVTAAEAAACAYETLHNAHLTARYVGIREKRAKAKEEEEAIKKK